MVEKWHPGEILSTSSAYWRGCVLQAAVRRLSSSAAREDGLLTSAPKRGQSTCSAIAASGSSTRPSATAAGRYTQRGNDTAAAPGFTGQASQARRNPVSRTEKPPISPAISAHIARCRPASGLLSWLVVSRRAPCRM